VYVYARNAQKTDKDDKKKNKNGDEEEEEVSLLHYEG